MKDTHELSEYFLENITEMLSKKGVKTSGWQEVALSTTLPKRTPA